MQLAREIYVACSVANMGIDDEEKSKRSLDKAEIFYRVADQRAAAQKPNEGQ